MREANAVARARRQQADELTHAALERLDKVADGVDDVEWGELTPPPQAPIHVHLQQQAAVEPKESDSPIPLIGRIPKRYRGIVIGIIMTLAALGLLGREQVARVLDALGGGGP